MSRVKLLLDVVENMHSLADSLQTMANAIAGDDATTEPQAPAAVGPTAKAVTLSECLSPADPTLCVNSPKSPVALPRTISSRSGI